MRIRRPLAVGGVVTADPGDPAGQALLDLYERVSGATHPDPQEFFEAMVADRRLVLSLVPLSATAQGLPE